MRFLILTILLLSCKDIRRPHVVLYGNSGHCSGIIVERGVALTAHHCKEAVDLVLWNTGERKIREWDQVQDLDLAIVRFNDSWNSKIYPICAPQMGEATIYVGGVPEEAIINGIMEYGFFMQADVGFGASGAAVIQQGCLVGVVSSLFGDVLATRVDLPEWIF